MEKLDSREKNLRLGYAQQLDRTLEALKDLMSQSLFVDCITSDQEANFDATIEFIAAVRNQVNPVVMNQTFNDFEVEDRQREDEEAWEQKLEQPV